MVCQLQTQHRVINKRNPEISDPLSSMSTRSHFELVGLQPPDVS